TKPCPPKAPKSSSPRSRENREQGTGNREQGTAEAQPALSPRSLFSVPCSPFTVHLVHRSPFTVHGPPCPLSPVPYFLFPVFPQYPANLSTTFRKGFPAR